MTLIQCFNHALSENMAGCLRLQPDKLILLGEEAQMQEPAQRFRNLLADRKMQVRLELCDLAGQNVSAIAATLAKLVSKEPHCVIDLTAGEERVILAIGAMLAQLDDAQRRRVSIQKYDMDQEVYVDCDGDGRVTPSHHAWLTVDELIRLHGGSIHPDSYQPPKNSTVRELNKLWRIVAEKPTEWNQRISYLMEFEKRSQTKPDVLIDLEQITDIRDFAKKETVLRDLLDQFQRYGIIEDRSSYRYLRYSYTSPFLRYCTRKAGNALEVKTLLEARALQEHGKAYFQDCRMSVSIDWDGVPHSNHSDTVDTRNEMDLVVMHGVTPLFISCKNGDIGEDELYKINTVATRFGGPHARKMLIATHLDRNDPRSNRYFIQRCQDMGIDLVTDAGELSADEWAHIFKYAML